MGHTMKNEQRWLTGVVICGLAVVWLGVGYAESPPDYEVIEIPGFYGEPVWYPTDLNNLGVVVGAAFVVSDSSACPQPFVWSKETGTTGLGGELDTCGAAVTGLNDLGQFVGYVDSPEPPGRGPQMYIREPDGTLTFPSLLDGDTDAREINNSGQVLFLNNPPLPTPPGAWFPYLLDGERVIDLAIDGITDSRLTDINDETVVVGYFDGLECGRSGFVWEEGSGHTLLGDCHQTIQPEAINSSRQVTGTMTAGPVAPTRAFLYADGVYRDLGTLGGSMSHGSDINDSAWIVGEAWTEATELEPERRRAFVVVDGVMYDLNDLLPADSPWELVWARAINNSGQILAYGWHHDPENEYVGWVLAEPVIPETVEELIEELIDDVEGLVEDGELNNGRGRSLIAELQVALWFLEFHNGERIAAIRLELFIKKVEQLLAIDQLDATLGSELLVKARAALQMLQDEG